MSDHTRPGTYTAVSAKAAGAHGSVMAFASDPDRGPGYVVVSIDSHMRMESGDQSTWSASVTAPTASDLLALFGPLVERLRTLAADELVAATTEGGK